MKIGVRVGDIMTREFVSVKPETSLMECAKIMVKRHVGSLIIEHEGLLKGIVTEKDIIWALTKKSKAELSHVHCKDISPRKIVTIKPSADLLSAIKLMQKYKFRRLPVVIQSRLVGILTLKDILRIEPELFEIARSRGLLGVREEAEKLERKKSPGKFDFGLCEECGKEDLLDMVDGKKTCQSCVDKM